VASEGQEGLAAPCTHNVHMCTCTQMQERKENASSVMHPTNLCLFLSTDLSDSTLSYTETEATNSLITAPGEFSGWFSLLLHCCCIDCVSGDRCGALDGGLFHSLSLSCCPFLPPLSWEDCQCVNCSVLGVKNSLCCWA
jgi:hypothetical protein